MNSVVNELGNHADRAKLFILRNVTLRWTEAPQKLSFCSYASAYTSAAGRVIRTAISSLAANRGDGQVCMYVFYGVYNYSGLVRKVSDFVMSVSVCRVHVISRLLDLRVEESRVVRQVKSPHCREATRKPRALIRVRTQAIGALAQGFSQVFCMRVRQSCYTRANSNSQAVTIDSCSLSSYV